jgi:hypothetical protein
MHDNIRDTRFARAFPELLGDLSDLVRMEFQLARAELSHKLSAQVKSIAWYAVAGLFVLLTLIMAMIALAYGIASYDVDMHWSFLIVAGLCGLIAAIGVGVGRSQAEGLVPERTIKQVKQDYIAVKEHVI